MLLYSLLEFNTLRLGVFAYLSC